jgi:hypothetical protein
MWIAERCVIPALHEQEQAMKRLMITAAALALLTTTAAAFTIDPATEAKISVPVDPPQKIAAPQVAPRQLKAGIGLYAIEPHEMVDVAAGTQMTVVKLSKGDPDNVCVLLPEATTKGLRSHSPSGCFWVWLKGASK